MFAIARASALVSFLLHARLRQSTGTQLFFLCLVLMSHFTFNAAGSAAGAGLPTTSQPQQQNQPQQQLQFMSFDSSQYGNAAGSGSAAYGGSAGGFAPPPPVGYAAGGVSADFSHVPVGGAFSAGPVGGGGAPRYDDDFDNEPPLLEELGINLRDVVAKSRAVLNPVKTNAHAFEDNDLSGPVMYILAMSVCHLLRGKLHFGILLGWSFVACVVASWCTSMIAGPGAGVDVWRGVSVIAYCALPMVFFSLFSLVVGGVFASMLAVVCVLWCTSAAANVLVGQNKQQLSGSWALVAYPCMLYYCVLAMLTLY